MPKKKKLSYIKKGIIIGGIFGVILTLLYNFAYTPILNIFTFIPTFIGGTLFALQHFIFKGNLFGDPKSSILYFISFIIIIFYILIGILIAYLIQKRRK